MEKKNGRLTNELLSQLLLTVGFEKGEETGKFRCVWRHREAGTVILLPSNKASDRPLRVDLLSVRTHLDYNGHMEGSVFDEFVRTEQLPVPR